MMERLTDRDMAGAIIDEADMQDVINKLYDYEEAEEQGLLLRLPFSRVYYIVDKGTKYATVMSKSIKELYVFEIKGIDKNGRYWSTKEKAEQKLKEMESD